MGHSYIKASDLPTILPLFPLNGALLLPRGQLPLNIFEPRYLNMIDDVMAGERLVGMIQTRGENLLLPELARVGCAGRITAYAETSDGRYVVTLTGICRFRLGPELPAGSPYRQARVDWQPYESDLKAESTITGFSREAFLASLRRYLHGRALDLDWETAEAAPPEALVNSLAMALPFDPAEKQALLEADTLEARCRCLTAILQIDAVDPGDEGPPPVQ